jgi:hypothetical protein
MIRLPTFEDELASIPPPTAKEMEAMDKLFTEKIEPFIGIGPRKSWKVTDKWGKPSSVGTISKRTGTVTLTFL